MNPGGKGANQAVAASRLGGDVTFICKIGNDLFGQQAHLLFEKENIDTSYIFSDPEHASGVALIVVDDEAENCITVASGANAYLTPEDIRSAGKAVEEAGIILIQLEIPLETVLYVAELALQKEKKLILNPAPAQQLPSSLMNGLYLITPNETEAEMISGIRITDQDSALRAASVISGMGVQHVIITLGDQGALLYDQARALFLPALNVQAVDTTAAGDVFNGTLAVALSKGEKWIDAIEFACHASAISVTRLGAQSSIPYEQEVLSFLSHS